MTSLPIAGTRQVGGDLSSLGALARTPSGLLSLGSSNPQYPDMPILYHFCHASPTNYRTTPDEETLPAQSDILLIWPKTSLAPWQPTRKEQHWASYAPTATP